MDFFEDDDEPESRPRGGAGPVGAHQAHDGGGGGGPHGGAPATPQQARVRQIGFLLGSIVVLILIVIAFRGCLDARKDRSFQNYVSDLSSITAETEPLSANFFALLEGEGSEAADDIGLGNEVNGYAGQAQGLLDRARELDSPDEVDAAQEQIILSYELRSDALQGIAAQLDRATGGSESRAATKAIYTQMRVLSASDILYARAKDQIEQALTDEEVVVDEGVPDSQFLPNKPDFLDPAETERVISGAAGGGGGTASDADCEGDGLTHGLGLVDGETVLQPSGTPLVSGGSVTAPGGDDAIDVSVQNQGEADESDIDVTVSGGLDGNDTIDSIAAGETEVATVPIKEPGGGGTVEVTVEVATVGCEQVADNNTATYSITF